MFSNSSPLTIKYFLLFPKLKQNIYFSCFLFPAFRNPLQIIFCPDKPTLYVTMTVLLHLSRLMKTSNSTPLYCSVSQTKFCFALLCFGMFTEIFFSLFSCSIPSDKLFWGKVWYLRGFFAAHQATHCPTALYIAPRPVLWLCIAVLWVTTLKRPLQMVFLPSKGYWYISLSHLKISLHTIRILKGVIRKTVFLWKYDFFLNFWIMST